MEVLDVSTSEEDRTISVSHRDDDTDVDGEDLEIEHICFKPKLIITDSDRVLKSDVIVYLFMFYPDNFRITF